MKFFAVAVVAVVFCAAAVYADDADDVYHDDDAPRLNVDAPRFREYIKCVDDVFGEAAAHIKELGPYHTEYKAMANEISLKVDECVKPEIPDSDNECLSAAQQLYVKNMYYLGLKMDHHYEGLSASVAFPVEYRCTDD